jgi:NTP pyrophosphatase (non-canonical NTP hydrolase)
VSADAPEEGAAASHDETVTIRAFQQLIEDIYGERDAARGIDGTFLWFVEEVGELARALKGSDAANLREEFADVLAWLTTLASLAGVDVASAATKYAGGCPRCRSTPCDCPNKSAQRATRE